MASQGGETRSDGHTVRVAPAARNQRAVQRFQLTVFEGRDAPLTWKSTGERAIIGTHESADLVLHDDTVSRFHCEISLAGGRVLVRDLDSLNGTLVDGLSVLHAHLPPGARLTLGRTHLRFDVGAEVVQIPLSERARFGRMVGGSAAMRAAFAVLERAAASDATVLLDGETGTGKELAAESLHLESRRKDGPFRVVDCGAIPPDLLESELFGHEKGAFTGAVAARAGAFEAASGGTIFLDEIGELDAELQPKLLRALESRTVKRVGGNRYAPVDVRVVAATNRDLRAEVNAGRFRSDLYYRLAVVQLRLPALRERKEDLPALVEQLTEGGELDDETRARLRGPEFVAGLLRHGWPGNVRELRNHLERCAVLRHPVPLESAVAPDGGSQVVSAAATIPLREARERWVEILEKQYLEDALRRTGNNVTAAAKLAGLDRIHFHRLLRRHGLR
jgi:DNA-binding NtrC family response regulator